MGRESPTAQRLDRVARTRRDRTRCRRRLLGSAPEMVSRRKEPARNCGKAAPIAGRRISLIHEYDEVWRSCLAIDPAQWRPSDIRIVVARPSAPDGETLLTPVDTPSLEWITNNALKEDIAPIANAALDALGKRLALSGEAYRPLRATSRYNSTNVGFA